MSCENEPKKQKTGDDDDPIIIEKPVSIFAKQCAEKEALRQKHAREQSELKTRQAEEVKDMQDKHRKAMREDEVQKARKEAGTEGIEYVCGTCAAAVTEEDIDDVENHFVCYKCEYFHCNTHKSEMTTCVECEKTYCDSCLGTMNVCSGCERCPQLTCCNLTEMPCGSYESGDCEYYHSKHCRCEDYPNQRYKW